MCWILSPTKIHLSVNSGHEWMWPSLEVRSDEIQLWRGPTGLWWAIIWWLAMRKMETGRPDMQGRRHVKSEAGAEICCHQPWDANDCWNLPEARVGQDWATALSLFTFMHWRRKWQPTPVFLPGEYQGRGSLVGCHLWGRTESDTTDAT